MIDQREKIDCVCACGPAYFWCATRSTNTSAAPTRLTARGTANEDGALGDERLREFQDNGKDHSAGADPQRASLAGRAQHVLMRLQFHDRCPSRHKEMRLYDGKGH